MNFFYEKKKRGKKVQMRVHETSCKLIIQHERKGQEKLSNWCLFLPFPLEIFHIL